MTDKLKPNDIISINYGDITISVKVIASTDLFEEETKRMKQYLVQNLDYKEELMDILPDLSYYSNDTCFPRFAIIYYNGFEDRFKIRTFLCEWGY